MLYSGTDPESCITEYTLVYEKRSTKRRCAGVSETGGVIFQAGGDSGGRAPHVQWTPVLLSEASLAHDVYLCVERPSGAFPPQGRERARGTRISPI